MAELRTLLGRLVANHHTLERDEGMGRHSGSSGTGFMKGCQVAMNNTASLKKRPEYELQRECGRETPTQKPKNQNRRSTGGLGEDAKSQHHRRAVTDGIAAHPRNNKGSNNWGGGFTPRQSS